jgi:two-component system, cell cycle sensor histidine kinase and response regulator CckA
MNTNANSTYADTASTKRESDITQSRKLESIGKLAGGIAHDYNNMLTAIIGYSELLMDASLDSEAVKSSVMEIHKAAKRAENLTRDLLACGRKQMLFPSLMELNVLVSSIEPLIREMAGKGIELEVEASAEAVFIKVDRDQFVNVIANLVKNACEAMPNGGKLTLKTDILGNGGFAFLPGNLIGDPGRDGFDPDRSFACLSVSDTGHGVDKGLESRIFEPYFTTKNPFRNPGLGLAIVQGIVDQSGGFINIESLVGIGSTFSVFFPRIHQAD